MNSENTIWMGTVSAMLLLSLYGFGSIFFVPWV